MDRAATYPDPGLFLRQSFPAMRRGRSGERSRSQNRSIGRTSGTTTGMMSLGSTAPGGFLQSYGGAGSFGDHYTAQQQGEITNSHNQKHNIRVVIRVRPPIDREKEGGKYHQICQVDPNNQSVTLQELVPSNEHGSSSGSSNSASDKDHNNSKSAAAKAAASADFITSGNFLVFANHVFTFNHAHGPADGQAKVYESTGHYATQAVLEGYNATILAYGQTGTGKTHTMEGFCYDRKDEKRGIIARSMDAIFDSIANFEDRKARFIVRASYLQIYNEQISDLLKPPNSVAAGAVSGGQPGNNDRDKQQKNQHAIPNLRERSQERNWGQQETEPVTSMNIREDKKRGVFVDNLSEWIVRSPKEVYSLIEKGGKARMIAQTKSNEVSSRSHTVFMILVEQSTIVNSGEGGTRNPSPTNEGGAEQLQHDHPVQATGADHADAGAAVGAAAATSATSTFNAGEQKQVVRIAKLNLVDLAGSERVHWTGAKGQQLEESKKINTSLLSLGNVIHALADSNKNPTRSHIPYRDSKLTRLLEDSLGGNCVTTIVGMISPAYEAFQESLSTLKFMNRAKSIVNIANVNVHSNVKIRSAEEDNHLLKQARDEIRRLNEALHMEKTKKNIGRSPGTSSGLLYPGGLGGGPGSGAGRSGDPNFPSLNGSHPGGGGGMIDLNDLSNNGRSPLQEPFGGQNDRELALTHTLHAERKQRRELERRLSEVPQFFRDGASSVDGQTGVANSGVNSTSDRQTEGTASIVEHYEQKLAQLEGEKSTITEDRKQIQRYKSLLLKQRDIMRTFTQRLRERDDSIMAYQNELDMAHSKIEALQEELRIRDGKDEAREIAQLRSELVSMSEKQRHFDQSLHTKWESALDKLQEIQQSEGMPAITKVRLRNQIEHMLGLLQHWVVYSTSSSSSSAAGGSGGALHQHPHVVLTTTSNPLYTGNQPSSSSSSTPLASGGQHQRHQTDEFEFQQRQMQQYNTNSNGVDNDQQHPPHYVDTELPIPANTLQNLASGAHSDNGMMMPVLMNGVVPYQGELMIQQAGEHQQAVPQTSPPNMSETEPTGGGGGSSSEPVPVLPQTASSIQKAVRFGAEDDHVDIAEAVESYHAARGRMSRRGYDGLGSNDNNFGAGGAASSLMQQLQSDPEHKEIMENLLHGNFDFSSTDQVNQIRRRAQALRMNSSSGAGASSSSSTRPRSVPPGGRAAMAREHLLQEHFAGRGSTTTPTQHHFGGGNNLNGNNAAGGTSSSTSPVQFLEQQQQYNPAMRQLQLQQQQQMEQELHQQKMMQMHYQYNSSLAAGASQQAAGAIGSNSNLLFHGGLDMGPLGTAGGPQAAANLPDVYAHNPHYPQNQAIYEQLRSRPIAALHSLQSKPRSRSLPGTHSIRGTAIGRRGPRRRGSRSPSHHGTPNSLGSSWPRGAVVNGQQHQQFFVPQQQ